MTLQSVTYRMRGAAFAGATAVVSMSVLATSAGAWSLEEAAAPYKGEEITVICDGYSPCLAYKELAKVFEERTGIKVNVEVADLLQVQQQILTDALTGTQVYDAVQGDLLVRRRLGIAGLRDADEHLPG